MRAEDCKGLKLWYWVKCEPAGLLPYRRSIYIGLDGGIKSGSIGTMEKWKLLFRAFLVWVLGLHKQFPNGEFSPTHAAQPSTVKDGALSAAV